MKFSLEETPILVVETFQSAGLFFFGMLHCYFRYVLGYNFVAEKSCTDQFLLYIHRLKKMKIDLCKEVSALLRLFF